MGMMTRLFNRLNGEVRDKDANPEKERNIYSHVYSYRGPERGEEVSEHMEATRNIDGSWEVARHRMTIDEREVGSVGYIPDWDVDVVEAETDFDTARRLVREYEEQHRHIGFRVSSFDGDDHDYVGTVDKRVRQARKQRKPAPKMAA